MSGAISSQGTKFYRWDSGTSAWVKIAEITGIEGPNTTRETIEVTTLDSVDGYREYIGSLREGGNANLTMNFTRATFTIFNTDFENDIAQNYAIVLPDTDFTTLEFEGLVVEQPLSMQVGDKISANTNIKITGKPILSNGDSGMPSGSPA